jgi:hypothetical protein
MAYPSGPNYLARLACISYLDRIASCVLGYLTYRQQNVLLSINASETSLMSACLHFAGCSDSKSLCERDRMHELNSYRFTSIVRSAS